MLDRNQFFNCPCVRQPQRVKELMGAGAEIRIFQPPKRGFASMHTKSWVFDGSVVFTGSPNTTEYGLTHNEEELWELRTPNCAAFVLKHFEKVWEQSAAVTKEDVRKAGEKVQCRRSRSKSESFRRSRSPRSLTPVRRLPIELMKSGDSGEGE